MKPEMRHKLAGRSFEEKIRKVSELIQLSRKVKASSEGVLLERLDRVATELDAEKTSSDRASARTDPRLGKKSKK
jgi:hypothetical protein